MNRLITSKEIESGITNLPTNKSPRTNGFTSEVYQTFNEELIPILLKFFQNIEEEGKLPKFFCEASITMTQKPDKSTKENYRQSP